MASAASFVVFSFIDSFMQGGFRSTCVHRSVCNSQPCFFFLRFGAPGMLDGWNFEIQFSIFDWNTALLS